MASRPRFISNVWRSEYLPAGVGIEVHSKQPGGLVGLAFPWASRRTGGARTRTAGPSYGARALSGWCSDAGWGNPWGEPRKSTVGAEETLSEFAGTGRSTQTLLPAQPSPSKRETTPANAVMTRPKASHSRPADGRVRASVKLYPITISARAAGQPRLWTLPSDERTGRFDQQRMRGLELLPGRLDLLRRLDLTLSCLEQ